MKTFGARSFLFVCFLVFVDQLSKTLVKNNLDIGQDIMVTDWFFIYFVENNGFAFGYEFFGSWGKFFLTTIRIFFVFFIFRWIVLLFKAGCDRVVLFSLLLIFSGAVGNIIDSVFYGVFYGYAPLFFGKVVDMFYFPIFSGFYPDWIPFFGGKPFVFFRFIFNFADAFISIGGVLLILFYRRIPLK